MASIWSIRRSATDVKVSGLCGGVARHWGVDPVLVRVGWVLLAFTGGIGLFLYLAGWLLVPADGQPSSTLDTMTGGASARWPREAWIAVLVITCLVGFGVFGSVTGFSFWPALILAVIWYFGYYKNRSKRVPDQQPSQPPTLQQQPVQQPYRYPGPPSPFTEAAEAWHRRMAEHARGTSSRPGPATQPATEHPYTYGSSQPTPQSITRPVPQSGWPTMPAGPAPREISDPAPTEPPPGREDLDRVAFLATADPVGLYGEPEQVTAAAAPSRRARSQAIGARRLRMIGLIALGLVLAGLGVADGFGAAVPPATYAAAALLVIGLTLVAATWFGRARGILPLGLIVLVILGGVTVANPGGTPLIWTQTVRYVTLAELPTAGNQLDVGRLIVDLSDLSVTRDASYSAHVDAGTVEVTVPDDVNIVVRYHVDQGAVLNDGTTVRSGSEVTGVIEPTTELAGKPTLTLDLSADLGQVQVQR